MPIHDYPNAPHNAQARRKSRYRDHITLFPAHHSKVTMEDIEALADDWPDMPDLEGGIDRYAQYPISGLSGGEA